MNNTKLTSFTSQWYNALVQSCGLNSQTFQLVKGLLPVENTSTIWKILDAIPPESINQINDGFGSNFFSTHYGAVIKNLFPQDSSVSEMQSLLSDSYIDWANYKTPPNPIPYQNQNQNQNTDPFEAKKIQFSNWCVENKQSQATIKSGIDLISEMQKLQEQMAQLLGEDYIDWENYTTPPSPVPPSPPNEFLIDISAYKKAQFQDWCLKTGQSQETITAGIAILTQVDFISAAVAKWEVASTANKGFAYTATAQGLNEAIERGQAKTVALDSKTQSSDTSNSWASGKVSGGYGFFGASASASWDKFSQDIQQKGVQLNVQFQKLATLTGSPLSSPNTLDIDLSKYLPWYDSKVIQTAYTENNNNVWKRTPPTWESTFGPNGNLKNLTVALVIVDGITSTMTTTASVAKENQEEFKAAAKAGYWPFFSTEGEGGWSTNVTFNHDGSVTITSASKAGNPNVLGVLVSPFTNAFNG
ncbi:hypothetical protein LC653_26395 [Nostoc sp. CHAB 5784]|uniref:hypothetical protein n=1 Tax=Nostoc mirabile TaxID=2907820 RepID=UPI001E51BE4F|nr:hypothetical protein [Nostoc mirabile]MCC5667316.1 hypothetical protein [Nostoc mirabile CHAB5784]